jgi:hypothetical protein
MRTGAGKTLTATMPAYLHALTGRGVHVMTLNDYLAERDAEWMGPPCRRSWPATFAALTAGLEHGEHYEIDAEHQTASLTDSGARAVEDRLGLDNLYAEAHLSLVRYLETALAVKECYQKGRDYSVSDGQAFDPTARQSVPVPNGLAFRPMARQTRAGREDTMRRFVESVVAALLVSPAAAGCQEATASSSGSRMTPRPSA